MKVSTFSKNQGNLIIPPLMKKIFVLVALISISVSTFQCKRTNNTPPNIVLFFVDDLGWQTLRFPFGIPPPNGMKGIEPLTWNALQLRG